MNPQRVLVVSFVLCCLIIAWGDIGEQNQFPRPSRLVSAGLSFAILGIVAAMGAANVAAAIGVGLNVAQIYSLKWANGDDKSGLAEAGEPKPTNPFGI